MEAKIIPVGVNTDAAMKLHDRHIKKAIEYAELQQQFTMKARKEANEAQRNEFYRIAKWYNEIQIQALKKAETGIQFYANIIHNLN